MSDFILKKIRVLFDNNKPLEEKIFSVILNVGAIVIFLSAIFTWFEKIGAFAMTTTLLGALFFLLTMVVYYRFKKGKLARLMLCYIINCLVLPVVFFTCGGIDSGMPLYLLGGLFIIIPTLKGRSRIICLIISLLTHITTIGISYNFMEGAKASTKIDNNILARLTVEARIIDMLSSIVFVSFFICMTTILILNAYQSERAKREVLLNRLDDLSKRDELTGLYNRRELFWHFNTMERIWEKHYYVAMFDIDHFKNVNDTYGHLFGDLAIKNIAGKINRICDGEDEIAARYGGEEFVLLFKASGDEQALEKMNGLREDIANMKWEGQGDLSITISVGLCRCGDFDNAELILKKADELLYEAKHTGRNRVCISGPASV